MHGVALGHEEAELDRESTTKLTIWMPATSTAREFSFSGLQHRERGLSRQKTRRVITMVGQ